MRPLNMGGDQDLLGMGENGPSQSDPQAMMLALANLGMDYENQQRGLDIGERRVAADELSAQANADAASAQASESQANADYRRALTKLAPGATAMEGRPDAEAVNALMMDTQRRLLGIDALLDRDDVHADQVVPEIAQTLELLKASGMSTGQFANMFYPLYGKLQRRPDGQRALAALQALAPLNQ